MNEPETEPLAARLEGRIERAQGPEAAQVPAAFRDPQGDVDRVARGEFCSLQMRHARSLGVLPTRPRAPAAPAMEIQHRLHLLITAYKQSLARGMKGLEVRLARALNRMMRRKGRVFGDRYHAHILKTPREAARALRYVLMKFGHHARSWGENISATFIDPFSSVRYLATSPSPAAPVAAPQTWLLRVGCHGSG